MAFSILIGAVGELPDRAARAVVLETDPDTGERNVIDIVEHTSWEGLLKTVRSIMRDHGVEGKEFKSLWRTAETDAMWRARI